MYETISAVVAGNLLTFVIFLVILGSLTFSASRESVWVESFLVGLIALGIYNAGINISILAVGLYLLAAIAVAVIQCMWIDARQIAEYFTDFKTSDRYIWMTRHNINDTSVVRVDYTKLSFAMAKYTVAAPMVIVSWCFGEFLVSLCREISETVGKFAIARVERPMKAK